MKRTTLNFVIDALAFAGFVLLSATGLIERYVLPPGSGGLHGVGTGFGAGERPVTILWGLTRHQWGEIHFWIAIGLMGVLAVHLFVHWRWIVCVVRGRPREGSGLRVALGIVGLFALLTVAASPFLSTKETVPRSELRGRSGPALPPALEEDVTTRIRGSMSLRDVEEATGTPVEYLKERLGLPQTVSPDERLGRLQRTYGIRITEVRRAVAEYRK